MTSAPDRNLALELARTTEAAALAASRWVGRGDKEGADGAAVDAMRLILGTAFGERPMRPEFGCGIHDYVFAPIDATTAGRVAYAVKNALERWEPRIDVIDVEVTHDDANPSTLYIDVRYAVSGTNDPRNLVFPFYVLPSE